MENLCNAEDCIPPTPLNQLNKACSRINKTSAISSKLSRKLLKNDHNGFKRKRIISPVKQVKQKVKQVTLHNFLVKGSRTIDVTCDPNASSDLVNPIKVNLLNKFEVSGKKNEEVISEVADFKIADEVSNSEKNSPSEVNECDKFICKEVAALELNSEKEDFLLSKTCKNFYSSTNEIPKVTHKDEEKSKDLDQTFSWMADVAWDKDKDNFEFTNIFPSCDMPTDCSIQLDCEFGKFKVKEIKKDFLKQEVKLVVADIKDPDFVRTCYLKGFWIDSIVRNGDTVHILNPMKGAQTVIDNDSGFLVVNPDFLISSTAVVSTLFCMRKAVFNYILPQWSPGNKIMMIGSLVHDVFQKCVNSHAITTGDVLKIVKSVMKKRENLIALCFQDLTESEMEENISKYIPNIIQWIHNHCSFNGKNTFKNISITKVEDIEENVWCPKYGIKGKIDMTVNAYCPKQATSKTMALELKTGRPTFSAEHIGQVNLYSIMMEERSKEASDGLLLYLRDKSEMKLINTNHNSKRGLIQLRNELASYIYKWVSSKNSPYVDIEDCHLPSPINNKRNCEKCSYLLPCTVYQKAFSEEKHLDPTHAMSKLIPSSTNHLTASHFEYFLHWSRLLLLESTSTAEVKAFWTESAVDREKQGLCLCYVLLDEKSSFEQETEGGYFIHSFIRSPENPLSPNFKNCCLKIGDYVAVSNNENLDEVAVAMGYIISVTEQCVQLAIERNLGIINRLKGLTFRIDKIISNSATSCVRNNIMLLMQDDDEASKLRKLIIDKEAPKFLQVLSKQIVVLGRPILKSLNKIQQKAVLKALMAEDYFLIKGMPGTGKTSTIVALVRLLTKMNLSVLLTSYTHSAVDNILLKLKPHVDFVRIGPMYRIHPEILENSFENLTKDFSSKDQFSAFMKDRMVVATTCLGVSHAIFKLRKFDICIVDEASQINQIACLGPLFYAKKFILVGDDKQLPPLVLNNEARQKGMQESLFQRLQSSTSCIELNVQYRMNREIMRLCNELTYNGHLQCGSELVANAVLHLDKSEEIINKPNPSWLLSALDTGLSKSVCFLNTDSYKVDYSEKSKGDCEADLVILILQFLLESKVPQAEIGIIAPYRRQVDLIESKLRKSSISDIEVNTVDQYQGRDKDVIIISCIRPSDSLPKTEKAGVILNDEKRLNVAISRARKKLILIGSKIVLSAYKPFEDLIHCLQEDQFSDVT